MATILYLPMTELPVVDLGPSQLPVTNNGATIDTVNGKFGNGLRFNRTQTDYLQLPNDSLFDFGTNNWTIHLWAYWHSWVGWAGFCGNLTFPTALHGFAWSLSNSTPDFRFYNVLPFGGWKIITSGQVTLSSLNHYALVRDGTYVKMYENGTLIAGGSWTHGGAGVETPTVGFQIGNWYGNGAGGYADATFSEFIIDDTALWTSNFTPPTSPLEHTAATTGNSLHLHFNESEFVDSSKQNKLITNNGVTIATSAGVFDGSSDYLMVSKANVLQPNNEDWEIDLIVDHTNVVGNQTYYSQYEDANNRCKLEHLPGLGYGLHFLYRYNGTDVISLSGGEITDSNEHHVALTKKNDTFRLFLDGVNVAETTYLFSNNELIDSDIYIGQDGNSANYFNGSIKKLRISNATRFIQGFSPDMSSTYETDSLTQLLLNFIDINLVDSAEAGLCVWNPTQVTRGNVDTGIRIYRFGNQCGYFSGSQDGFAPYSLQLPDHPNWNIGDRDFTLDTWLYPLSHFNRSGIFHQNTRVYWYIDSMGKLNWYIEDGAETFSMQSSGTVPVDEWSHCAITRSLELTGAGNTGQVWRMYIKGIIQDIATENFTIPNLTGPLWIGRGTGTSDLYHGYMDELRLFLDKAIWTENSFWPWDYPYLSEEFVHRYRRMHRRRIHAIQGR